MSYQMICLTCGADEEIDIDLETDGEDLQEWIIKHWEHKIRIAGCEDGTQIVKYSEVEMTTLLVAYNVWRRKREAKGYKKRFLVDVTLRELKGEDQAIQLVSMDLMSTDSIANALSFLEDVVRSIELLRREKNEA